MGCASSQIAAILPRKKQAQRGPKKQKKIKEDINEKDYQDLNVGKQFLQQESIKTEQSFVKVKKHDQLDIQTQIVTEEKFTKYTTARAAVKGQKFTDQEFQPVESSLTTVSSEMPEALTYEWKRPEELFEGKKFDLFQGKIEPNDIVQGQLGDCYFLSALSVLAERENLIQKLFINKSTTEEGIYGVFICIDGVFQEVIVDDHIPSKDGRCVFSRSNEKDLDQFGGELWVMILEKVYAKVYGGYNQIVSGHAGNAIRDLTGAPTKDINCSEGADKVWDFIFEHERLGHMLTAGSQGELVDGKEVDRGEGIVSGHAYAILDAQVVESQGQEERIIQMRNPWGNKEWQGNWSDKSDKWTEELKKKLNFTNEDDGVFWIEINDFLGQFSDVTTNFVNDQYLYSSLKFNLDTNNHMALVKFNVQNDDTHAFIQITQKDRRHFKKDQNYEYSLASILICKGDFTEWIDYKTSKGRNITIEGEFQKGTYIAFVNIEWCENKCDADFVTISAYSSSQIQFNKNIDFYNDSSEIKVLDSMLICQPPENSEKIHRYEEDKDIIRYQGEAGSYVYFQFINKSQQNSILHEKISLPSFEHLQIMPPFTDSSEFEITVNPGEAKVVKYKTLPEGNGAYGYSVMYGGQIELSNEVFQQKLQENASKNRKEREDWKVYESSMAISGGYAFLYQNESQGTYIENVELDLNNLQVVHSDKSIGQPKFEIKIQSGETYIFQLKIIDPTQGYSYGSSFSYSLQ